MKSARTPEQSTSAKTQTHSTTLTGRERRLAQALLAAPAGLSREPADKAARASNSPDVVSRLRSRGVSIRTEMRACVTVDGTHSRYCVYHLQKGAHKRLQKLLEGRSDPTA